MNASVLTIGADPEIICSDKYGSVKSIVGHLGGSKEKPVRVKGGAVQEDNVLAEFNIPPSDNEESFSESITTVIGSIERRLPDFRITKLASANFDIQDILDGGVKAMTFGCSPDYDAYTDKENKIGKDSAFNFRTAGGHIHLGLTPMNDENKRKVIKLMDLFLGIPSVILDKDRKRKELYGKAGSFRYKDYGIEYRTLSNFWIFSSNFKKWVFRNSKMMINHLNEVEDLFCISGGEENVRFIIDSGDELGANKIINELNIPLPVPDFGE